MMAQVRWFVCLMFLPLSFALAQPQGSFYGAAIAVESQSSRERARAAKEGFMEVMLRISGTEEALLNEVVQSHATKALRYIEQYQYKPITDESLLEQGLRLSAMMKFSPAIIEKVLAEAQLPFWSNRPKTLVWLAVDDPVEGRMLVNNQNGGDIIASLEEAAGRRGLPLTYPLLDLDDRLAMPVDNVWEINEEAILAASERYDADVILVGRYSKTSKGELWSIWHYFHDGASRSYDSRVSASEDDVAESSPELIEAELFDRLGVEALYPLADFLADRYAIRSHTEAGGRLVVQVGGIGDFALYRQSLNYFEGLAAVSNVLIAGVRQDTLLLFLESEADIDKFLKMVALDGKLHDQSDDLQVSPSWQPIQRGTLENPLRFMWSS